MLLCHRRCARSISLSRATTLRRPQLPPRCQPVQSLQDTPASSTRLLATCSDPPPSRRRTTPAPHRAVHRRLATAVQDSLRQDDMNLDGFRSPIPLSYAAQPPPVPVYHLRNFDPSRTLQVKGRDEPLPRARAMIGVPGAIDEMLTLCHACIGVNRLDRAALVLERIGTLMEGEGLPYSVVLDLHNKYLRARIARALEQPESDSAQPLHGWFELQIRKKNLPYTPETIACMIKASLLSSKDADLDRLVNRYMDLLPRESIWSMLDAGVLDEQDVGILANIYEPIADLAIGEWDTSMDESQISTEEGPSMNPRSQDNVVPDVRPVPQKGLGLKTLRGVLSFFNQIEGQDLASLSIEERREIQGRLEKDCVEAAVERWREESQNLAKIGRNTSLSSASLNSQLYDWQCSLEKKIQEDLDLLDESEQAVQSNKEHIERCIYGPLLKQSTPARLAAVTIVSVLNSLAYNGADKGVAMNNLLNNLSKSIEEDIRYQLRQKEVASRKLMKKIMRQAAAQEAGDHPENVDQSDSIPASTEKEAHIVAASPVEVDSWPIPIRMKVGARLLAALFDSAKVTIVREHPKTKEIVSQVQPALSHTSVHRKGKLIGIILPNKALMEMLKQEPRGDYLARHLPMLVEPQPWSRFDRGGYLHSRNNLVRIKAGETDQKIYTQAALERGNLDQVCKGLDVLGRTAWQINRPVFDVMLEAWNSGDEIANIPPLHPDIPVPEEPATSEDPMVRRTWLKRVRVVENIKSGLHSERCFMNFQLDIARSFRDQTFYFPHNMDFRGRAYPIPAYLNHMGADHVRGLLRFAKGKELGENGLRWLKVHLANVFGFDKASLREREAFAMDHIRDVRDSASNPLSGEKWWLKAEDPWQCLAACFELKAALDSPDPAKFVSYLPVHQDGTCNGLQHYAALGGDRWGAQQVNLTPGDRPADVYSAVADLVNQRITKDVEAGHFIAKAVAGKITRKVVKQTVMTNVYGVTFIGAKAQVTKQIEAAYPKLESETGVPPMLASSYIATQIFGALSTMFRGAHDIQYWLGECAGRVCNALSPEQMDRIEKSGLAAAAKRKGKSSAAAAAAVASAAGTKLQFDEVREEIKAQFRNTIVWTTPLRMPVVQPYRKNQARVIETCIQDLRLTVPDRSDPVNKRKQLQAFPPNFIHSLDASHMLLSALECDERGLVFAAVHDSFWTHAADVDVMSRVLRDAFVRIHSEDVIGRLASEFKARYKGYVQLTKIDKSSAAGAAILAWRKKTRIGLEAELILERQRLRLVHSADEAEVQKGREMVTPGSIYEELGSAEQTLRLTDELDDVALGGVAKAKAKTVATVEASATTEAAGEGRTSEEQETPRGADPKVLHDLMTMTHFEASIKRKTSVHSKAQKEPKEKISYTTCWIPLDFPEIPKKGDFDVSQLKDSQYFFS
ncbi:DNA-dependent RNA polymerase [Xylariaceae sp. FL0594]|nr:DNA-dependent RNA polymerase [Xylariaceae sp. FL0594]